MDAETVLARLNTLTGMQNDKVDLSVLSSAQLARFLSWAKENRVDVQQYDNFSPQSTKGFNLANSVTRSDRKHNSAGAASVGIDVQSRVEFFPNSIDDLKGCPEINNIFSQKEIAYAETRSDPELSLTGLFAAKEALLKAGACGRHLTQLNEIEIGHTKDGRPIYDGFSISISHSADLSIAVAVSNHELVALSNTVPDTSDNESSRKRFGQLFQSATVVLFSVLAVYLEEKIGFLDALFSQMEQIFNIF